MKFGGVAYSEICQANLISLHVGSWRGALGRFILWGTSGKGATWRT